MASLDEKVNVNGPALVTPAQSSVSHWDTSSLGNAIAGAADAGAQALDQIGAPLAQQQGEADGQKMVSLDANGKPVVQQVPPPPIVGQLGQIYQKSAMMAYQANLTTAAHTQAQTLAQQAMLPTDQGGGGGDPNWFLNQMNNWVKGIASSQRGGFQLTALQQGNDITQQYYRTLLGQRNAIDAENQKQTFQTQIDQDRMTAQDLAEQGATDTPAYQQAVARIAATRQQMSQDPRMGYSPAKASMDNELDHNAFQEQAVIGSARRYYDQSGDLLGAQRKAEDALNAVPMDPARRLQLLGEVNRHLAARQAYQGQAVQELNSSADAYSQTMQNTHQEDPVQTSELVDRLNQMKSFKKAADVQAVAQSVRMYPAISAGTADQAAEAMRRTYAAVQSNVSNLTSSPDGRVDPTAARALAMEEATKQGLVGYVPPDGAKYGIKTGSAQEWGNYFVGLGQHESGLNNGNVGDVGSFGTGSRGLYQLSQGDAPRYGLNGGKPFSDQQLADPYTNTAAAVSITKQLLQKNGSIQAGPGQYWGPINKEGWTPGTGRDANLPWAQWAAQGSLASPYASDATKHLIQLNQAAYNNRAQTLWDGMKQGWNTGGQPSSQEIGDLSKLYPYISDQKLANEIHQRMLVETTAANVSKYPLADQQALSQMLHVQEAQGGSDLVTRETTARIDTMQKQQQELAQKDPVTLAQQRLPANAAPNAPQIQPLDLSSPDNFAAGIKARQTLLGAARQQDPTLAATPLTVADRTQVANAIRTAPGQAVAPILSTLGSTLTPEEAQGVFKDDGMKNAVIGLTTSGDPQKMQAAYGFLSTLEEKSPLTGVDKIFDKDTYQHMRVWQDKTSFQPPDMVAKQMMTYNDPSATAAMEKIHNDANDELKSVTNPQIMAKVAPSWFGNGAPVSDMPAAAMDGMRADYSAAYRDFRLKGDDAGAAASHAAEQVAKNWGPSPTNNGAIMKYPPEAKAFDPKSGLPLTINGSFDWMRDDLEGTIADALGVGRTNIDVQHPLIGNGSTVLKPFATPASQTADQREAYSEAVAAHYLVPDDTTKADIDAGRAPSYHVVVQGTDGSLKQVMSAPGSMKPLRWYPDYKAAAAKFDPSAGQMWLSAKNAASDALSSGAAMPPY